MSASNLITTTAVNLSSAGIVQAKGATNNIHNVRFENPVGNTNNAFILAKTGTQSVSATLFTKQLAPGESWQTVDDDVVPDQIFTVIGDDVTAEKLMVSLYTNSSI